ncbi:hypothetical protein LJC18_05600, partial [Lachnospiraceae bacterium OttesenSCG-928-E19]|nr:hypothetical protein [Lachnospiraceae bacterium OttesenSCG-928-E19]
TNICVALTCKSGYTVVDGLCKTESGVTIVTLNKGGGTGTLLSVSGTTSATITCNDHKCNFPSVETLTRANSTYQYSTDGTYHQEGQWCTQPNGGGDCYTPEQIHEINTPTITLYAMWNCRGGYYASTPTSCTAAGAGYYSPKYSNERIECEPGYYCAGTTSATHLSCPIRYPKSDPRNISNMTCYRDCPEMPGALTIAEGGHEYQGLPSTCAATSCMDNWELVENACIPLNASCPPGYYYDGSCKDCPPGNYCVGDEEPLVACPASHSMSDFRNPSQSTCYSPCLPGEHNAVLMSGRNYYDDAYSTCRATFCMNGFTLEDGICVRSQCPVGQFLNNDVCDTCGVGQWYDAERGDGCTPVGSEYYSPTNDSRRYECPSGTLSGGDGNYAASMADCANFKTLMVYDGTNTIGFIMRTSQITTPALRVWDGDNIYYGNVSTQSSGGKQLQITNTNGTYYLRDNVYTP